MKFDRSKYSKILKPLSNKMVLILIIFSVWMLFLDRNSWFIHNELNEDIEKLEEEKQYYENEIAKDKKEIEALSSEEGIEKFGREHYKMKKDDEEIYIVEYEDSLKNEKKD